MLWQRDEVLHLDLVSFRLMKENVIEVYHKWISVHHTVESLPILQEDVLAVGHGRVVDFGL